MKARLIAGDADGAAEDARWALDAGAAEAGSPIGRYAAALALLVLGRDHEARVLADELRIHEGFPTDVGDALAYLAAGDRCVGYIEAIESVLESFETRGEYLEDVPVADTVLALQALAAPTRPRGRARVGTAAGLRSARARAPVGRAVPVDGVRHASALQSVEAHGEDVVATPERGAVLARARELVSYAHSQGYDVDELKRIIEDLA